MSKVLPLIGFIVEKNLLFVLCCKNLPGKCRLDGQHGGIPRVRPHSFCGYFCEKSKDDISSRRLLFLRTTTFQDRQ
jgi:hypothetical protein